MIRKRSVGGPATVMPSKGVTANITGDVVKFSAPVDDACEGSLIALSGDLAISLFSRINSIEWYFSKESDQDVPSGIYPVTSSGSWNMSNVFDWLPDDARPDTYTTELIFRQDILPIVSHDGCKTIIRGDARRQVSTMPSLEVARSVEFIGLEVSNLNDSAASESNIKLTQCVVRNSTLSKSQELFTSCVFIDSTITANADSCTFKNCTVGNASDMTRSIFVDTVGAGGSNNIIAAPGSLFGADYSPDSAWVSTVTALPSTGDTLKDLHGVSFMSQGYRPYGAVAAAEVVATVPASLSGKRIVIENQPISVMNSLFPDGIPSSIISDRSEYNRITLKNCVLRDGFVLSSHVDIIDCRTNSIVIEPGSYDVEIRNCIIKPYADKAIMYSGTPKCGIYYKLSDKYEGSISPVQFNGDHRIRIVNNLIEGNYVPDGIIIEGAGSGNLDSFIHIERNTIDMVDNGIVVSVTAGNFMSNIVTIDRNIVTRSSGASIMLNGYSTRLCTITHNVFFDGSHMSHTMDTQYTDRSIIALDISPAIRAKYYGAGYNIVAPEILESVGSSTAPVSLIYPEVYGDLLYTGSELYPGDELYGPTEVGVVTGVIRSGVYSYIGTPAFTSYARVTSVMDSGSFSLTEDLSLDLSSLTGVSYIFGNGKALTISGVPAHAVHIYDSPNITLESNPGALASFNRCNILNNSGVSISSHTRSCIVRNQGHPNQLGSNSQYTTVVVDDSVDGSIFVIANGKNPVISVPIGQYDSSTYKMLPSAPGSKAGTISSLNIPVKYIDGGVAQFVTDVSYGAHRISREDKYVYRSVGPSGDMASGFTGVNYRVDGSVLSWDTDITSNLGAGCMVTYTPIAAQPRVAYIKSRAGDRAWNIVDNEGFSSTLSYYGVVTSVSIEHPHNSIASALPIFGDRYAVRDRAHCKLYIYSGTYSASTLITNVRGDSEYYFEMLAPINIDKDANTLNNCHMGLQAGGSRISLSSTVPFSGRMSNLSIAGGSVRTNDQFCSIVSCVFISSNIISFVNYTTIANCAGVNSSIYTVDNSSAILFTTGFVVSVGPGSYVSNNICETLIVNPSGSESESNITTHPTYLSGTFMPTSDIRGVELESIFGEVVKHDVTGLNVRGSRPTIGCHQFIEQDSAYGCLGQNSATVVEGGAIYDVIQRGPWSIAVFRKDLGGLDIFSGMRIDAGRYLKRRLSNRSWLITQGSAGSNFTAQTFNYIVSPTIRDYNYIVGDRSTDITTTRRSFLCPVVAGPYSNRPKACSIKGLTVTNGNAFISGLTSDSHITIVGSGIVDAVTAKSISVSGLAEVANSIIDGGLTGVYVGGGLIANNTIENVDIGISCPPSTHVINNIIGKSGTIGVQGDVISSNNVAYDNSLRIRDNNVPNMRTYYIGDTKTPRPTVSPAVIGTALPLRSFRFDRFGKVRDPEGWTVGAVEYSNIVGGGSYGISIATPHTTGFTRSPEEYTNLYLVGYVGEIGYESATIQFTNLDQLSGYLLNNSQFIIENIRINVTVDYSGLGSLVVPQSYQNREFVITSYGNPFGTIDFGQTGIQMSQSNSVTFDRVRALNIGSSNTVAYNSIISINNYAHNTVNCDVSVTGSAIVKAKNSIVRGYSNYFCEFSYCAILASSFVPVVSYDNIVLLESIHPFGEIPPLNSPVIDAGNNSYTVGSFDVRGLDRVFAMNRVDIGAYEVELYNVSIRSGDIKRVYQDKLRRLTDGTIVGSKVNLSALSNVDDAYVSDLISEDNIMIELGSSILSNRAVIDKHDTLVGGYEAVIDTDYIVLVVKKNDLVFRNIARDSRFYAIFSHIENRLTVYEKPTYSLGVSGLESPMSTLKHGGSAVARIK